MAAGSRIVVEVAGNSDSLQAAVSKAADSLKGLGDVLARQTDVALGAGGKTIRMNELVGKSFQSVAATAGLASRDTIAALERQGGVVLKAADTQVAASERIIRAQELAAAAAMKSADEQVRANDLAATRMETSARRTETAFGNAHSSITKGGRMVTLGLFGVAAASVYMAAKFQESTTQLNTQAGATIRQVEKLRQGMLAMAGDVGFSPEQLSQGMYHVVSAMNALIPRADRVSTELKVLRASADLARVGNSNLEQTTYALSSAMNAYRLTGKDANRTAAELNAIVGAGDLRMQDLVNTFESAVIPTAASAGVSLRSLGAAIATMGDLGQRGAITGTRLRMAIALLSSPSEAAAKVLETVGLSAQQATSTSAAMAAALEKAGLRTTQLSADLHQPDGILVALQDLHRHLMDAGLTATGAAAVMEKAFGGARTGATIVELYQNLDRLQKKYDQIGKTSGSWNQDVARAMGTTVAQFDRARAGVEALSIEIGTSLLPDVNTAIHDFNDFVAFLKKGSFEAHALEVGLAAVGGVLVASFAASKIKGAVDFFKMVGGAGSAVGKFGSKLFGGGGGGAGGALNALGGQGELIGGIRSAGIAPGSRMNPIAVVSEGGLAGAGAPGTTGVGNTAEKTATDAESLLPKAMIAGLSVGGAAALVAESFAPKKAVAAQIVNDRIYGRGYFEPQNAKNLGLSQKGQPFKLDATYYRDIGEATTATTAFGQAADKSRNSVIGLSAAADKAADSAHSLTNIGSVFNTTISGMVATANRDMPELTASISSGSTTAAQTAMTQFRNLQGSVELAMRQGVMSTGTGLQTIRDDVSRALKEFGAKALPTVTLVTNLAANPGATSVQGFGGYRVVGNRAVGGFIGSAGERGPDTVPILAGRGEAILNHAQQGVVNSWVPGGLSAVFSQTAGTRHMAAGGYVDPSIRAPRATGGAVGDVVTAALKEVAKAATSFVANRARSRPGGALSRAASAVAAGVPFSGPTGPGNAQSWTKEAMGIAGVSGDLWMNMLMRQEGRESSWNPNSVNNWDSNAKAGDPSEGILQTTLSTFATYHLPGHNNILNPVDNIVAAIRYMISRYGSGNSTTAAQVMWARGGGAYSGGGFTHDAAKFPSKVVKGPKVKLPSVPKAPGAISTGMTTKDMRDLAEVGGKVNAIETQIAKVSGTYAADQTRFGPLEGEQQFLNADGTMNAAGYGQKIADDDTLMALDEHLLSLYMQEVPIVSRSLRKWLGRVSKTDSTIESNKRRLLANKEKASSIRMALLALDKPTPNQVAKLEDSIAAIRLRYGGPLKAAETARSLYRGKDKATKTRLADAVTFARAAENNALEPLQYALLSARIKEQQHAQAIKAAKHGLRLDLADIARQDLQLTGADSRLSGVLTGAGGGTSSNATVSALEAVAGRLGMIDWGAGGSFVKIDTTMPGEVVSVKADIQSLMNDIGDASNAQSGASTAQDSTLVTLLQQQNLQLAEALALNEAQTMVISGMIADVPQYKEGGPVLRDTMAMVHQGEYVVPKGGALIGTPSGGTGPTVVNLHHEYHGNAAALFQLIDSRIRHPDNVRVVSKTIGQRTSMLSGAPGGYR